MTRAPQVSVHLKQKIRDRLASSRRFAKSRHQWRWKSLVRTETTAKESAKPRSPCFYADFMKCQPLNFKGAERVGGLTRWIEEKELGPEQYIMNSGCAAQAKRMTKQVLAQGEIKKLEIEMWNRRIKKLHAIRGKAEISDTKRRLMYSSRRKQPWSPQQQPFKRVQNVAKGLTTSGPSERKPLRGIHLQSKCNKCHLIHNGPYKSSPPTRAPRWNFRRDCQKLKNKDGGNGKSVNKDGFMHVGKCREERGKCTQDTLCAKLSASRYNWVSFDSRHNRYGSGLRRFIIAVVRVCDEILVFKFHKGIENAVDFLRKRKVEQKGIFFKSRLKVSQHSVYRQEVGEQSQKWIQVVRVLGSISKSTLSLQELHTVAQSTISIGPAELIGRIVRTIKELSDKGLGSHTICLIHLSRNPVFIRMIDLDPGITKLRVEIQEFTKDGISECRARCAAPILALPEGSEDFAAVYCDASHNVFSSRRMNYTTHDLEAWMGCVKNLQHWLSFHQLQLDVHTLALKAAPMTALIGNNSRKDRTSIKAMDWQAALGHRQKRAPTIGKRESREAQLNTRYVGTFFKVLAKVGKLQFVERACDESDGRGREGEINRLKAEPTMYLLVINLYCAFALDTSLCHMNAGTQQKRTQKSKGHHILAKACTSSKSLLLVLHAKLSDRSIRRLDDSPSRVIVAITVETERLFHCRLRCLRLGKTLITILMMFAFVGFNQAWGNLAFVMPSLGWRWTTEALTILEKVAKTNGQTLPPGILVSDHEIELSEKSTESEDAHLLPQTKFTDEKPQIIDHSKKDVSTLGLLFSPELVKPTLLLWVVFFGNAFSYYGLVLLTTELHNGRNSCGPTELQSTHEEVSYKDIFITSFAEFPGLIISAITIDKLGRKGSMSTMFFLCCIFLLPLVFHQPQGVTTALLFMARICITTTFTVIYPTSVRTTGVGVGSSVGRIGGMICPLVAVGLIHGCHQTAAILLFEFVIFASGVCVLLFPFETSGRELTDTTVPKEVNGIGGLKDRSISYDEEIEAEPQPYYRSRVNEIILARRVGSPSVPRLELELLGKEQSTTPTKLRFGTSLELFKVDGLHSTWSLVKIMPPRMRTKVLAGHAAESLGEGNVFVVKGLGSGGRGRRTREFNCMSVLMNLIWSRNMTRVMGLMGV
ncbi:organic cation/carnitine transporter 7 isoform X1 [Tanacetum coccineum]